MPNHALTLYTAALFFVTTANEGASTHGSAWALRAGLAAIFYFALRARPLGTLARDERWLLLTVAAVISIATFASHRPQSAVSAWASVATVLGLYLAGRALSQPEHDALCRGVLIAAALQGLWAVGERLSGVPRAGGGFFDPNMLAAFAVSALAIQPWKRSSERLTWLFAACAGAGLVASASRAGLIALAAAAVGSLIWRKPKLAVGTLAIVVLIGVSLPSIRERFEASPKDPFAYDRVAIWRAATDAGLAAPIVGHGLGDARSGLLKSGVRLDHGEVRYPRVANHAHNEVLNAWVELGLIGVLLALLPVLWVVQQIARRKNYAEFGPLLAFAVPALVASTLHSPPIAALAALWAARLRRAENDPSPPKAVGLRRTSLGALTAALILTLPALVSFHLSDYATRQRDQGKIDAARRSARIAALIAPHDLAAQLLDASLDFQSGGTREPILERLLDLADRFETNSAVLSRAQFVAHSLDSGEARDRILLALAEEATRRAPHDATAWVNLAREHLRAGTDPRAAIGRALELEPNCASALILQAGLATTESDRDRLARHAMHADARAQRYKSQARAVLSLTDGERALARSWLGENFTPPQTRLE